MIKINLLNNKAPAIAGGSISLNQTGFTGTLHRIGEMKVNQDFFRELFPLVRRIVVGIGAIYLANWWLEDYKATELKQLQAQISTQMTEKGKLQAELNKAKDYDALKKSLDADEFLVKTKLQTIQKLIERRTAPHQTLLAISQALPKDVWFQDMKVDEDSLSIKGSSNGYSPISDFMKSLGETTFFMQPDLKSTKQVASRAGEDVVVFEILAKRRKDQFGGGK